jgi:hypothetical protein
VGVTVPTYPAGVAVSVSVPAVQNAEIEGTRDIDTPPVATLILLDVVAVNV